MAIYENAEIRKGGKVIRVNVTVDVAVPFSAGIAEWGGTLRPPNNIGLSLGESYVLALPECSPARILITSEASAVDATVTFKGVGEVPVARASERAQGAT